MISQYCKECLKFRNQHCKGKEGGKKTVEYFGAKSVINPSFLNFCKAYEFDKRLMPKHTATMAFDTEDTDFEACPNKNRAKNLKHKRAAAKRKRVDVAINISAAEEVEAAENLKSADFDDLLI